MEITDDVSAHLEYQKTEAAGNDIEIFAIGAKFKF